ncbi:MAG: S8 family serine peptidase [Xanthomonadales bacterium]|nr:S8 family serine peptidase [Xanthomonadales bacterium]
MAKSPTDGAPDTRQTYIVVFEQPSLAEWHVDPQRAEQHSIQAQGAALSKASRQRLDVSAPEARSYLRQMDEEFGRFRSEAARRLGRDIEPRRRFQTALNGLSAQLSAAEAAQLAAMPGVKLVEPEPRYRLHTDAGPGWIGADGIWTGEGPLPEKRGEGIVVAVIDSGINWGHLSFSDPGGAGGTHDFTNPLGSQKGLCSLAEVPCNDKLIGVYDYIEDDPQTEVVEENTNGEDNDGHGSHVASIAVGNPLQADISGVLTTISGVAPNANLISHRVCYIGDPDDSEDDSCPGAAILEALDQVITDGVDVVNYSLGSVTQSNPWSSSISLATRNIVASGIFFATSAGNEGPAASTMNSPGNSPWLMTVGSASHNRFLGNTLENLVGGNTTPPIGIFGASLTGPSGFRSIVHAKDFGNALCGTGTEELGSTCNDNTGATNPFAPGTFNGEIVVCDRGQYGRVEKGKNVLLAGAGGMILANTEEQGESIVSDNHCLPAIHVGEADGDALRTWLSGGGGHAGTITGFDRLLLDELGDQMSSFSSRGPNQPEAVADILKPNLIAPGASIIGASVDTTPPIEANPLAFLAGTSQASPHVAGAAALILSVHPGWTPAMLSSALQLTADPSLATDFDDSAATPHERGAGRPQLVDAANAGLYLNVTNTDFVNANPSIGGSPRNLNLPTLTDSNCQGSCSFTRTVTDLVGGKAWTATPEGFPAGAVVTVSPANFTLSSGGSRALTIEIDLTGAQGVVGNWVYAGIRLAASGVPNAVMPVTVFAQGGDLPAEWHIFTDRNGGWQDFALDELTQMPQATFTSGGLVPPQIDSQVLPQDPTRNDPYDGGAGILTVWHTVPEGALWLHARTLDSTAPDVDLFVGRDNDGDGIADANEEICNSTTPLDLELCDLLNPVAGEYWIIAQNWDSGGGSDEIILETAVVPGGTGATLNATGPGRIDAGDPFDVRLSWHDVNVPAGTELLGAVGIGTHQDSPGNIGVIPVYFTRNGVQAPATLPVYDGVDHRFALTGLTAHDRAFIDIPQGASELSVSASGADNLQNNGLQIDLYRVDFDNAFSEAPFASAAPAGAPEASASGSGGNGPQLAVSGGTLQPGRWYLVIRNNNPTDASVVLRADVSFDQPPITVNGHLWISAPRPNISQGIDFQPIGAARGLLWYTYADNRNPAWYLSAGATPAGNIWHGRLLRFTNDGADQQFVEVGRVAVTMLETDDSIFSWTLFGHSGSERMDIIAGITGNPCPVIDSAETSISGFWGKAQEGLGGASVLFTDSVHAEIHYMYDILGNPVWLQAAGSNGNDITLTQFEGYCPTCAATPITTQDVGVLTHDYVSSGNAGWVFDYLLAPPLSDDVERSDTDVIKLSDVRACD